MKNKKLIYFFAVSLSIIFSLLYLIVFHYYIPSKDENKSTTLYLNQVGLYKEKANATKVLTDLSENKVNGYIYRNDDVYVVVCGVSKKKVETQEIESKLKGLSYSYITKKIDVSDEKINELIDVKEYQKALELIANQS